MAEVLTFDKIFYTNFEPKLKNRFIMEIDDIPSFIIKAAQRPTVESEDVELHHINLIRKIKGKTKWNDITIKLYDPIVPSGAQAAMEWIRTSHESVTGRDGYADFYKRTLTFKTIGPVGDVVEQWKLVGAYIKTANFGDMDWSEQDPMEIELTIRYDYAILEF
jgi:hypothetical protein